MEALRRLQDAFFAKAQGVRPGAQDGPHPPAGRGADVARRRSSTAGARRSARRCSASPRSAQLLHEINLGATAIGTTVTAAPGYPELATKYLSELTGIKFILAGDLIEATSDTGAYVLLSGVLKRTSVKLTKICNDIRLLASGPRCGFNEINLPQMQPGSLDHAGQGESGDPGSREPDRLPGDRPRPHGDARGLGRAAAAERDGAGDHLRALHLDRDDGARGRQPARSTASTASPPTPSARATWCSIRSAS